MQLASAVTALSKELSVQGKIEPEEARSVIRLLLAKRLSIPFRELFAHAADEVNTAPLQEDIAQLAAGLPVQYLLGETEFMGLNFLCRPPVFIPRQDSECLVERALAYMYELEAPCIADVCCGSGTFGLTLARSLPQAQVLLSDVSPAALALAQDNAAQLGVTQRCQFVQGDLLEPLLAQKPAGGFHLITCNPPYIPSGQLPGLPPQVQQEPTLALDGGADGLDPYRRLAAGVAPLLAANGLLIVEHGDEQQAQVRAILDDSGLTAAYAVQDLGHRDRGLIYWKQA